MMQNIGKCSSFINEFKLINYLTKRFEILITSAIISCIFTNIIHCQKMCLMFDIISNKIYLLFFSKDCYICDNNYHIPSYTYMVIESLVYKIVSKYFKPVSAFVRPNALLSLYVVRTT